MISTKNNTHHLHVHLLHEQKQPKIAAKAAPAAKQPAKAVAEKVSVEKKQPAPAVDYKKASTKGPEPVKEGVLLVTEFVLRIRE